MAAGQEHGSLAIKLGTLIIVFAELAFIPNAVAGSTPSSPATSPANETLSLSEQLVAALNELTGEVQAAYNGGDHASDHHVGIDAQQFETHGEYSTPIPEGTTPFSQHIIIKHCNHAEDFFDQALKHSLTEAFNHSGFPVDTVSCPNNHEEEERAFADIIASYVDPNVEYKESMRNVVIAIDPVLHGDHANYTDAIEVLERGAKVFWIEAGPQPEDMKLGSGDVMSLILHPDDWHGGYQTGATYCSRLPAAAPEQNIVLLYGPHDEHQDDHRVDGFMEGFTKTCGDAVGHRVTHNVSMSWEEHNKTVTTAKHVMQGLFISDPTITTIVCANDAMAIGVIEAAEEILSHGSQGLYIAGFGHTAEIRAHLKRDTVFASVDELVEHSDEGLPFELAEMAKRLRGWELHDTDAACAALGLEGHVSITTPVQLFVGNMAEYVYQNILETYKKSTQPVTETGHVTVRLGLKEVSVSAVDVPGTSFSVSFWLETGWNDPRISWDTLLLDRTLHIPKEDIWVPDVYIANTQTTSLETKIFEPKAIVEPNGDVKLMVHFNSMLSCDMDPTMYPHDRHSCDIQVGVFATTKVQQLTVDLTTFEFTLGSQASGWNVTIPALHPTADGPVDVGTKVWDNIAVFHLGFERNPSRYSWNYIIPALLLQLVGFSQFWFHVGSSSNVDRGGVATVALLSIMALQSSIESFDTENLSWMDIFFFLNILFLFLSFIITMTSAYSEPQEFEPDFAKKKRAKRKRFSITHIDLSPGNVPAKHSRHTHMVQMMWNADNYHDQCGKRYLIPAYLVIIWLHSWNLWQYIAFGEPIATVRIINAPLFSIVAVLLAIYMYILVAQFLIGCCRSTRNDKDAKSESGFGFT